jgi:hypothetical protein
MESGQKTAQAGQPAIGAPPAAGTGPGPRREPAGTADPKVAVLAAVAWSLWELRATVTPARFLNDSSVHEQMVRFAASQLRAGHDPLTAWFPYLGLGSPQFLHYQGTPAVLTGLAGLVAGPDTAFRWSLYLLWCLWPVAVYGSARVLGLTRWAAALAAVVAPLLHSVPGVGYEQHAYVWAGYGLWTQLWGSWALPFAWALSWRAVACGRFLAPAAGMVALTVAFHFETGYLALGAIVFMPFLVWRGLAARLARAGALLGASLLACAWVVVPLLRYSRWAAINQALAGTPLVNGYSARQTLGWLAGGGVFDDGHLPVVSLLVAAGTITALLRWRRDTTGRVAVALLCFSLVLSLGRTTFGSLTAIVPGGTDVFFRRFLMGAQLAGIYLAGIGGVAAAQQGRRLAASWAAALCRGGRWAAVAARAPAILVAAAGAAWLAPAWRYCDTYDAVNGAQIQVQHLIDQHQQGAASALAAYLRGHGDGRAWAGSPQTDGHGLTLGYVPMFACLESLDIDEAGYTLRTASLMTQPEYHFDPANPGDYSLFGIRYLVRRAGTPAPPPRWRAVPVLRAGRFEVFKLPANSYLRVADIVGSITADRADLGSQTAPYLASALPGAGRYPSVAYAGHAAAPPTLPSGTSPSVPAGRVLAERPDLAAGRLSAVVHLRRRAAVVLSASFDPGWTATADGHPAPVQMVAPALAAVTLPPGTHDIAFTYRGFGGYPWLLALAAAGLLALWAVSSAAARSGCRAWAHSIRRRSALPRRWRPSRR